MAGLDTQWLIMESLWLLSALGAILLGWRLAKDAKCLAVLLSLAIASHVFIFNNPAFFRLSNQMLGSAEIGWRQKSALLLDPLRFTRSDSRLAYLFVGSSQVGAVFGGYSAQQRDWGLFMLAGMGPLDFVLYAREVGRMAPRDIVLYLSDFDLGAKPSMLGAKLAPPQSAHRIAVLLRIMRGYPTAFSFAEIQDFLICQAFSPYRYQYIFRGILDNIFRKKRALPETDVTAKTNAENMEDHLKFIAMLSDQWFDVNLHLLDVFVGEMAVRGIGVIIVEGHYHPQALRSNWKLHSLARARLEQVARKHPNCRYIPTGDAFDARVYLDGTHVKSEAGAAFATLLREELDRASNSIAQ
jgi:hypothetical protein